MEDAPAELVQSPLRATLARLAAIDDSLTVAIGVDDSVSWILVSELNDPLGQHALQTTLESFARDGVRERRVQTAWFVQGYAWLVSAPAVACLLDEELVPCLALENVAFRPPAGERFAEVALVDERRYDVATGDLGRLRQGLEGHLDPGRCTPPATS